MDSESELANTTSGSGKLDLQESESGPAPKKAARKAAKKAAKSKSKADNATADDSRDGKGGADAEASRDSRPAHLRDGDGEQAPKSQAPQPEARREGGEASNKRSVEDGPNGQAGSGAARAEAGKGSGGASEASRPRSDKGGQGGQAKPYQHGKKQKGGKGQKFKRGKDKGNRYGGWTQPPPPRQTDRVEGELPPASRFAKLEDVEALRREIDESQEPIDLGELYELGLDDLRERGAALGLSFEEKPGRKQVLEAVFKLARESKRLLKDAGYLDLTDAGHGFIAHASSNYQLKPESVYVPQSLVRHYSLKRGLLLEVEAAAPAEGERCPAATRIFSAMGEDPETVANVASFEDLVPYYPTSRMILETPLPSNSKKDVSMRAFDILTPVGFGQRGLIVAPPRTGKTVLLQGLANSLQTNYPEAHLIVLLVDERPEEVTDFKRQAKGEVISSTFDETADSHVHAAEMVIEKARRMVERGRDVVILLDSITRLARAYNALASNSGKIMTGGLEATALQKPKRFFGSARNIEDGGSLTIFGTALVDTGSKMDEVIFEEFKGTGNMELHLDRDLINKRVFPAINFERSGTRKEELLYHPQELEKVYGLRRVMQGVPSVEAMEMLIKRLKATNSNAEFLMSLK